MDKESVNTDYIKTAVSAVIPYSDGIKNGFVYVLNLKEGKWGLPGGKLELFEKILCASSREIKEETGLDVLFDSNSFLGIWYFKSERGSCINNTVFCGKVVGGKVENTHPKEIGKIEILTLGEIRELYHAEKIRAGRANLEPVEEYLRGTRYPISLVHTLF